MMLPALIEQCVTNSPLMAAALQKKNKFSRSTKSTRFTEEEIADKKAALEEASDGKVFAVSGAERRRHAGIAGRADDIGAKRTGQ